MVALMTHLEDVPRAVTRACRIPAMNIKGFCRVMTKYRVGRITTPWISKPMITVMVYMPSWPPICVRSSISTIFPAIRNRMPMGAYLRGGEEQVKISVMVTCSCNTFH